MVSNEHPTSQEGLYLPRPSCTVRDHMGKTTAP